MADGKGCICNAWNEGECACDADWTPQIVYDLRAQIAKLTAPPSEGEILLCAAFSHNTLNSKGSFLNCTKEYRDEMLTIAKAAITKLLEMRT